MNASSPIAYQVATAADLQREWSRLRPVIMDALPFMGGTHDESDLIKAVLEGGLSMWAAPGSFVLAMVERCPRLTRVCVTLAGGKPPEVDAMMPLVEAWGVQRGATQLFCAIRPGLERVNRRDPAARLEHGWQRVSVNYVKEL
jgi:hypothetical protein